ncbi:MAG TPA: Bax inhibitor-1/YccA family protein [Vicinamibacteria bacterium]|nr:Bax inhibitor-1/YccA family protein [Vicinamibacteria bacterium]
MRTMNPTLNENVFVKLAPARTAVGGAMSVAGTVNKTAILLMLALLTAGWTWNLYTASGNPAAVSPWLFGGLIGGLVAALVTVFKQAWAPVTAPIYALLEGLVLGGISAIFEASYPGIVVQAIGLTFGTLAALLLAYKAGLIRVTDTFRKGVVAATGGIFLFYMASFVLGFFGISLPLIHSSGTFGILFSLAVVGVAALNLVLDFDLIERGAARGAPKFMEWYAAFGVMVTLVWLYLELLRLLAKLRDRR